LCRWRLLLGGRLGGTAEIEEFEPSGELHFHRWNIHMIWIRFWREVFACAVDSMEEVVFAGGNGGGVSDGDFVAYAGFCGGSV
jgi:hypothetical protein